MRWERKCAANDPACDYVNVNNMQTRLFFQNANFEFAKSVNSGTCQRWVSAKNLATACLLFSGVSLCKAAIAALVSWPVPPPGALLEVYWLETHFSKLLRLEKRVLNSLKCACSGQHSVRPFTSSAYAWQ